MNKVSQFFLYLLVSVCAIGAYNATLEAQPISSATRFFALSGFFLMTVSVAIGPLAIISPKDFAHMVEPRRAVGIASFAFVLCHFALSFLYQFGADVSLLFYSLAPQLGLAGLLIMVPLAITSSDWATRKMGPVFWKNLQRVTYFAFVLSFWHFILASNGLSLTKPNFAEMATVLFAIATVCLQIAGFYIVSKRKRAASKKAETEAKNREGVQNSQNTQKAPQSPAPQEDGSANPQTNPPASPPASP